MDPSQKLNQLSQTHSILAGIFQKNWDSTLREFAPDLYKKEGGVIEPELIEAFRDEWADMGIALDKVDRAICQLKRQPVIQTSHHITPSNGPTFLAFDTISLAGLSPNEIYLVGANSGVSFSNSAWSGAINYGELALEALLVPKSRTFLAAQKSAKERKSHGEEYPRISLIPSKWRDKLVFGTPQFESLIPFRSDAAPALRPFLADVTLTAPFSHWAAETCRRIQSQVLRTDNILIFDINRVITRYLITILRTEPDHPISVLLLEPPGKTHLLVPDDLKKYAYFFSGYQGKKSAKVDPIYKSENGYESRKTGLFPSSRNELITRLEKNQLCPGVVVLFFVIRFLNGIRCLGSFNQIEYLDHQRRLWESIDTEWDLYLEEGETHSLTTGRLINNNQELWPVDMAVKGESLLLETYLDKKMSDFWTPILNQLLGDL